MLPSETKVWTSKYLNNIIEQDHRRVKQRVYPMLGFKKFENAAIAISGIELAQQTPVDAICTRTAHLRV